MIMGTEINDRVQAGMAFLDEHFPDHVDRVNLDNLDINSGAWCPLAQAAGTFYVSAADDLFAKWIIDLRFYDDQEGTYVSQKLGFFAMGSRYGEDAQRLDEAWIAAYRTRKAA